MMTEVIINEKQMETKMQLLQDVIPETMQLRNIVDKAVKLLLM